jgi:peptidoglycan/LPS O-acetylase OafA/YrhL
MMKALPEALPRDGHPPARYVTLDGMRGLAAIAVALFHFDIYLVPHGYLAVDFFFVLSGFVLYRSYLPRLREGLGIGRFMLQRLARLYPLFMLGLMLGVALALQQIAVGDDKAMSGSALATTILFNGAMLPSPVDLPLYPLNVPSWSLFFEIVASFALVALLFRLPRFALAGICLLAAVGLVPIMLDHGSGNIGALWHEYDIALMRTAYSFTFGAIIASLPEGHLRKANWLGVACIAAIGILLAAPVPSAWTARYDLLVILVLSPALVFLGTRCEPVSIAAPIAAFAGEVSYALYAVHWSFIEPMRAAVAQLGLSPVPAAALFLAVMLTAAAAAVRWYDLPLRRRLTAMLRRSERRVRPLGA